MRRLPERESRRKRTIRRARESNARVERAMPEREPLGVSLNHRHRQPCAAIEALGVPELPQRQVDADVGAMGRQPAPALAAPQPISRTRRPATSPSSCASPSSSPSGPQMNLTSPRNSPCSAWYASAAPSHQRRLARVVSPAPATRLVTCDASIGAVAGPGRWDPLDAGCVERDLPPGHSGLTAPAVCVWSRSGLRRALSTREGLR